MTLGPDTEAFLEARASFNLSDVALLGTCLHVDSSVTEVYNRHILADGKLPIPFQSVIGSRHIVNGSEFTLSLSRSISMLKQLYFVIVKNTESIVAEHRQKVEALSEVNLTTDIMSFQAQCGSQKFPDNECIGVSESYFRLLQALGHEKDHEDISIFPAQFVSTSAIFGIDFEKAGNEALYSGISTRQGKVMTLTVKNSQASVVHPHTVFVYQVYDGVCNIRSGAVDVEE